MIPWKKSYEKPSEVKSLSCPTLCNPMDCSPPGSSVHGIFQARVLDSILKSRGIALPTKVHITEAMVFPVVIYGCELDHKESWVSKNWCFWSVVLEKTLESLLDCKEIKPVNPEGNQSWIFIGRTDVEVETPILCPPDRRTDLSGKDPDAGKD